MIMRHLIRVQRQHRHGSRCVIDTVCEIRSTLSVAGTLPRLVLFPMGYVNLSSFVRAAYHTHFAISSGTLPNSECILWFKAFL
jgi:hypothetical protein